MSCSVLFYFIFFPVIDHADRINLLTDGFILFFSVLGSLIATLRLRSEVYLNHQLGSNNFVDVRFGKHFT